MLGPRTRQSAHSSNPRGNRLHSSPSLCDNAPADYRRSFEYRARHKTPPLGIRLGNYSCPLHASNRPWAHKRIPGNRVRPRKSLKKNRRDKYWGRIRCRRGSYKDGFPRDIPRAGRECRRQGFGLGIERVGEEALSLKRSNIFSWSYARRLRMQ